MSLSNLPPGVTQKMIDDHFGGPEMCFPCEDDQHEDCQGNYCECPECVEAARADYYEALAEERRQERRHGGG